MSENNLWLETRPRRAYDCEDCPVCGASIGFYGELMVPSNARPYAGPLFIPCWGCRRIPVNMTDLEIAYNAAFWLKTERQLAWRDRRGARLSIGDLVRYVGVLPDHNGKVFAVEELAVRGGAPVIVLRAGIGTVQTSGQFVVKQPKLDGESHDL